MSVGDGSAVGVAAAGGVSVGGSAVGVATTVGVSVGGSAVGVAVGGITGGGGEVSINGATLQAPSSKTTLILITAGSVSYTHLTLPTNREV